jgi:hypothetical protein
MKSVRRKKTRHHSRGSGNPEEKDYSNERIIYGEIHDLLTVLHILCIKKITVSLDRRGDDE